MTIYINNYSINLHWMKIIYKDSVEDTKKDDIILATKRRKLLTSLCHSPSPSNKCSSNQTPTQTSRCALRGTFPIWFPDCLAGLLTSSMSSFSCSVQFSSVQSLSHVWLFVTLWTSAHQASLSITNSQSLPKFMSIEWCHLTISSSVISYFLKGRTFLYQHLKWLLQILSTK